MKKFLRSLALGVVAAALTVGVSTTSASALSFMSATMSVSSDVVCCHSHSVTVTGVARMSQSDAQRFLNYAGNEATASIWADDSGLNGGDDKLVNWSPVTQYWTAADGLHFSKTFLVSRYVLNEDSGQDEVYVMVSLLDIRTGLKHQVNTNIVKYYW